MSAATEIFAVCPVDGCENVLGVGPKSGRRRVFCPSHWRRIPYKLQLRISRLQLAAEKSGTRRSFEEFVAVYRLGEAAASKPRRRTT